MIDMVFAAVDSSIREKIISAYLAGHVRNQIDRELHEQGVKVSHGSISNIVNAYKREHEQKQSKPNSTNTSVPLNNISSPSSIVHSKLDGDGKAITSATQELAEINFADEPYDYDILSDPNVDYDERYDGVQGELRLNQYINSESY